MLGLWMAPLLTPFMVSGKTTSRFDSINTHPLEPLSVRYGVAACIICESRVAVVPAFRVHVRVRIYPRQSYSRLAQGTCRDALLVIDRASVDRASIFTISEPTERAMQKW